MNGESLPPVLSVAQVSVVLGVSPSSVWNAIKRGEIKSIRLGRRVLVPSKEIGRLLAQANGGDHPQAAGDGTPR